jgi:hypothetical protein
LKYASANVCLRDTATIRCCNGLGFCQYRTKKGERAVFFADVKNKRGTAHRIPPPGYTSWLDFWEKTKNTKADNCEVVSCIKKAQLGGHVIKVGEGGKEYILPMCYQCNNKPENEVFKAWQLNLVPVR